MLTLTTLQMLENEEGRAKAARIAAQKARITGIQPPRTPIPYPNPTSKAKLRSQTEKTRLSNQRKIRCAKNEKEWAKRREDDAKAKKTREAGHPAHTRARGKRNHLTLNYFLEDKTDFWKWRRKRLEHYAECNQRKADAIADVVEVCPILPFTLILTLTHDRRTNSRKCSGVSHGANAPRS